MSLTKWCQAGEQSRELAAIGTAAKQLEAAESHSSGQDHVDWSNHGLLDSLLCDKGGCVPRFGGSGVAGFMAESFWKKWERRGFMTWHDSGSGTCVFFRSSLGCDPSCRTVAYACCNLVCL